MDNNKLSVVLQIGELKFQNELKDFIENYYAFADKLIHLDLEDNIMRHVVDDFTSWLDIEGTALFQTTIERLDVNKEKKIRGFIQYYDFLLSSVQDDASKLVDQLFAIPSQFAKEFMISQGILHGSISNQNEYDSDKENSRYTFNTQGAFEQVPCFIQ